MQSHSLFGVHFLALGPFAFRSDVAKGLCLSIDALFYGQFCGLRRRERHFRACFSLLLEWPDEIHAQWLHVCFGEQSVGASDKQIGRKRFKKTPVVCCGSAASFDDEIEAI